MNPHGLALERDRQISRSVRLVQSVRSHREHPVSAEALPFKHPREVICSSHCEVQRFLAIGSFSTDFHTSLSCGILICSSLQPSSGWKRTFLSGDSLMSSTKFYFFFILSTFSMKVSMGFKFSLSCSILPITLSVLICSRSFCLLAFGGPFFVTKKHVSYVVSGQICTGDISRFRFFHFKVWPRIASIREKLYHKGVHLSVRLRLTKSSSLLMSLEVQRPRDSHA